MDTRLRPVTDVDGYLREAHSGRTSACVVRDLASRPEAYFGRGTGALRPSRCKIINEPTYDQTAHDEAILLKMKRRHPQFRWAVASPPEAWVGKRSGRDAHLARQMARQGMSASGVADALKGIPHTKAADRGEDDYATAIATWDSPQTEEMPALPGMKGHEGKRPWRDRYPPPKKYGDVINPWWDADVQERLKKTRAKATGPILAFLIGFWWWGRGLHPRRMFYLGRREISKALDFSEHRVRGALRAIERGFADVVRVVRGRPHKSLRIATAFDVPSLRSDDQVTWCVDV